MPESRSLAITSGGSPLKLIRVATPDHGDKEKSREKSGNVRIGSRSYRNIRIQAMRVRSVRLHNSIRLSL